ncbi:MAG: hypothetical protein WBF04_09000 [Candidatus Sulfotelmatobacter sp.]
MATECSGDCHSGKRKRHSDQQWQAGTAEGLVCAREYKWQDRQNARTQNRQNTANKRQEINQHRPVQSSFLNVRNIIDRYPEVGFIEKAKSYKTSLLSDQESGQVSKPVGEINCRSLVANSSRQAREPH